MIPCPMCSMSGIEFYEGQFFCSKHWRELYALVSDAQKKVTKETIDNYIKGRSKHENSVGRTNTPQ